MSAELRCHGCGYDLRAHPEDGACPECGASVAEARRVGAIPVRPAWGESDPRWRRRVLAGAWILVLMPLMDWLEATGWASELRVPNVFGFPGAVRRLDDTFLCGGMGVFPALCFCSGVVLLFSTERGRCRARWDWTRRWGVLCSYVVLLLAAVQFLFISALVLAGVAALFQSLPLKHRPGVERWFVEVSAAYLRYGPYPSDASVAVLVAFSSITMLLACVPLFDALRSSGPRILAGILVAPLAVLAVVNLWRLGGHWLGSPGMTPAELFRSWVYFRPELLITHLVGDRSNWNWSGSVVAFASEATKWCTVLAIAVWLTVARVVAWWRAGRAQAGV